MAKVLYTGGTFDIFHYGHVEFLRKCHKMADFVVVSLNRDEFVSRFKRRPIMTFEERIQMLNECQYVDLVIENEGDEDSRTAILSVMPDIIAIGDDWKKKDYLAQLHIDRKFLRENGIKLVYLPYTKSISTTKIIERCRKLA